MLEIEQLIREQNNNDENMATPGYCRYAAERILVLTESWRDEDVNRRVIVLAYPKASKSEETHYCIELREGTEAFIINTVATSGFPPYIGPKETAPGLFSSMEPTLEIL